MPQSTLPAGRRPGRPAASGALLDLTWHRGPQNHSPAAVPLVPRAVTRHEAQRRLLHRAVHKERVPQAQRQLALAEVPGTLGSSAPRPPRSPPPSLAWKALLSGSGRPRESPASLPASTSGGSPACRAAASVTSHPISIAKPFEFSTKTIKFTLFLLQDADIPQGPEPCCPTKPGKPRWASAPWPCHPAPRPGASC